MSTSKEDPEWRDAAGATWQQCIRDTSEKLKLSEDKVRVALAKIIKDEEKLTKQEVEIAKKFWAGLSEAARITAM